MKAAVCHEHGEALKIEQINIAAPSAEQVKVKVAACAICHSDIHFMQGAWKGKLPAVFGHEAAGVVVEVGSEVSDLKVGDRVIVTLIKSCGDCFYCDKKQPVMCDQAAAFDSDQYLSMQDGSAVVQGMKTGAFAEYVLVSPSQTCKIPQGLAMDAACLLACGVITGVGAVKNTAQVKPGSSVMVIGSGGVGLNAIQGARLCGATTIIAMDLESEKLSVAKQFGATHVIDARDEDVKKQVKRLTEGRGVDYVLVTVGAKQAIDRSYDYIRRGGEAIIVGMPAIGVKSEYYPLGLAGSVQTIKGSFMGQSLLSRDIPWLLDKYQNNELMLDELISHRYALEDINLAIEDTLKGKSLRNVLIIDDEL